MKITLLSQLNGMHFVTNLTLLMQAQPIRAKQHLARNMASILSSGTAVFWWSMHVCCIPNRFTYVALWDKFSVIPCTK